MAKFGPRGDTYHIEIRNQEKHAFLLDPDIRPASRYVKTHRAAIYVDCPFCKAAKGHPCRTVNNRTTAQVCELRRDVFYERMTEDMAREKARAILKVRKSVRGA